MFQTAKKEGTGNGLPSTELSNSVSGDAASTDPVDSGGLEGDCRTGLGLLCLNGSPDQFFNHSATELGRKVSNPLHGCSRLQKKREQALDYHPRSCLTLCRERGNRRWTTIHGAVRLC